MRVTLATTIPGGGPIEQALVLGRAMAARGVEVAAVCGEEGVATRFEAAGVPASVVLADRMMSPGSALQTYRIAAGSDVVHAHDRRAGLWMRLGPRPRRRGVRVYTAHGVPDPYLPPPVGAEKPGLRDRFAYTVVDPLLCRRADAVVVPSRSVAGDLVRRLNYPERRMRVIPNGVDPEAYADIPREPRVIGTVSRLDPFKGLDVFVQAASLVRQEIPDTRFAMFGSGDDEPRLTALVRSSELSECMEMPGRVPASQALGALRVYVLSSYWENAPIALLEAMAAGIPIVATNVHGVPEMIDETCAELVEPGDAHALAAGIVRVLSDIELTNTRVENARDRLETEFSADENAARMIELYEALLAGR